MPWKECSVMDERLRFVAKLLDGESMTEVCREFGISRKTGYKVFQRYKDGGFEARNDLYRWLGRFAWRSIRGCHLCLRYVLAAVRPGVG